MLEKIKELYTKDLTFEEIMVKLEEIIVKTTKELTDDKYEVKCNFDENLDENILGYTKSFTEVCISSNLIKEIQDKNILSFGTILMQLEYINQNYEIFIGKAGPVIMQIIKEDIILSSDDEWKSLKCAPVLTIKGDYNRTTQNVLGEYNAYKALLHILNKMNMEISKEDYSQIISKIKNDHNILLGNYYHSTVLVFDILVDFDDYFDEYIYHNPKWLKIYPQLNIEYYVDENGFVCKKDRKTLINMYEESNNSEEKEYIQYLLSKLKRERTLFKS